MSTSHQQTAQTIDQLDVIRGFSWLHAFAGVLTGLATTGVTVVMLLFLLMVHGPQLLVILSSGELTLHQVEKVHYLSSAAMFIGLAGYSFSVGLRKQPEQATQLIFLWGIWAVVLTGLSALWFLSPSSCGIQISLNAFAMALGLIAARPFAQIPRPKKLKQRSDLQWLVHIVSWQGSTATAIAFLFFALLFCSVYTSEFAERVLYVGRQAPVETLLAIDGSHPNPEQWQGKVVLLDCWGLDSPRGYLPTQAIHSLRQTFAAHDDLVIASVCNGQQNSKSFSIDKCDWQLFVRNGKAKNGFQRSSIGPTPTAYIIDRKGTITQAFNFGLGNRTSALESTHACQEIKQELSRLLESQ